MKEALRKISIRGPKTVLNKAIDALKSTGCFEQTVVKLSSGFEESSYTARELLSTKLARVKNALDYSTKGVKHLDLSEMDYFELKKMTEYEDIVLGLMDAIDKARTKSFDIKNKIKENIDAIAELKPYAALDVNLNMLRDTKEAFVLAGIIPTEQLRKFKSDFSAENIFIKEYLSTSRNTVLVCLGHKEDYPVISTIFNYDFERCKLSYQTTAAGKIKELYTENNQLAKELKQLEQEQFINSDEISTLKMYYDYLNNELNTLDTAALTLQTENFFILNGWILESKQTQVELVLQKISPALQFKFSSADKHDSPPVLVKNSALIKPYQSITNLYGAPGKNDLDPNPFVAFFYFLFFGIMIGDIGYGIIMFAGAFAILMFLKPKRGIKDLIAIICMGGISAALWGIIFGSFFGGSTQSTFLPNGVIDPINNALIFLVLSLGLGVLHIVAGIFLKFCNLLSKGKIVDAFFDAFIRIILFAGIICVVLGMFLEGFEQVANIGIWIAVGALIGIALTAGRKNKGIFGKIQGGFGGIYSLVNYFGDVLSYARLFGLGLVGSVIALVANTMGELLIGIPVIGLPLGIIIALVFHVFNLAIGLLSAYVHNARLQFVEFFGKFYEGGGHEFTPLGKNMKYVTIKSDKPGTVPQKFKQTNGQEVKIYNSQLVKGRK